MDAMSSVKVAPMLKKDNNVTLHRVDATLID
jgi:hypothetical protein